MSEQDGQNNRRSQPATLDESTRKWIDTLADQFDAAWQAAFKGGQPPEIESFVNDVAGSDHPALRRELELIDQEYRQRFVNAATNHPVASVVQHSAELSTTVIGQANLDSHKTGAAIPGTGHQSVEQGSATQSIGEYELLGEIGHGGMGVVYKAIEKRTGRSVALKRILAHQTSPEIIRRFVMEAEFAANLDHPNIVPIYHVGEHEGQPYFSMKFVEGQSLSQSIKDGRIADSKHAAELVETISRAVQFAHSHGILHRDLKPANILIDQEGQPHVTDFGLAKRLDSDAGMTQAGAIMGTPAYMAPEQTTGNIRLISVATDVYALGAILFELLTGRPPFQADDRDELYRRIQQEPTPSPRSLSVQLHPDLDTICLKCLEKDPAARYASAEALADDLRRFVNGEPIAGRRISDTKRLWLWCRRNPRLATLSATVLLLVTSIAVGSTIGMFVIAEKQRQAVDARDDEKLARKAAVAAQVVAEAARDAERCAKDEADKKRIDAEKARDETKQVLDYLVAAFRKSDPETDGETLTVVALFLQATEQLESTFPSKPLIQAQLLDAIGRTYYGLGLHEKAITVHERARNLRRNELGEDHEDTLTSMNELALAYQEVGREADTLHLCERTLELRMAKLGPAHADTLESMVNLASVHQIGGRLADALPLLQQSLELMKANFGLDHRNTLVTMNNLAHAYMSDGRLEKALPLFEQTLELSKSKLGPEHPQTLGSMSSLVVPEIAV